MEKTARKIPVLDINQSCLHVLKDDPHELEMQPGGRVAFMHEAS